MMLYSYINYSRLGYGEGTTISMRDSCFAGTAHFAPSGEAITISNGGVLPHTLSAVDGSFDTGLLEAGKSTELIFDEPGIYRVFCTLHGTTQGDGMAGVVVVGEAESTAMAAPLDTSANNEAFAAGQTAFPSEIVVAPEGSGTIGAAVMIVSGLAAGLALAALLTVLSLRFTKGAEAKLDRLEPMVDRGQ